MNVTAQNILWVAGTHEFIQFHVVHWNIQAQTGHSNECHASKGSADVAFVLPFSIQSWSRWQGCYLCPYTDDYRSLVVFTMRKLPCQKIGLKTCAHEFDLKIFSLTVLRIWEHDRNGRTMTSVAFSREAAKSSWAVSKDPGTNNPLVIRLEQYTKNFFNQDRLWHDLVEQPYQQTEEILDTHPTSHRGKQE